MTRRMMLLVLALLGLMVLVATATPPQEGVQNGSTPTPAPGLTDPEAFDVSATLSTDAGEEERTVEAQLGDRVLIVVEGDEPANVLLEELRTEPLDAGHPARFELLAETAGAYPLVLLEENRRIGTLEIR